MFLLKAVKTLRDMIQGFYGNGIPLDHPVVLKICTLWNELVESSEGLVQFDAFEICGADPQVRAELDNRDFMEIYRHLREVFPAMIFRPLWRAENGLALEPSDFVDLEHFLTHLAEDLAASDLPLEKRAELLRIKIFDSQGLMHKVQSSINIIKKLRDKGHPITAEIAIPYSGDEIYPDLLYVDKVVEAARMLEDSGLPLHLCHLSLKDMAGELSAARAKQLLPKIIDALKEEGIQIPFGLHLHNTGLAPHAYAEAIAIFKQADYPLTIDTVECAQYDKSYTGEEEWRNSGFASLLHINKILLDEKKIDLGLKPKQIKILEEIGELVLEVSKSHALKRAHSKLTGPQLREFHIAGGAFASLSTAVSLMGPQKEGLANLLGLSEKQALQLAGKALIAAGRLMGHPFGVTPGFQNKQIFALNMLQNMINAELITRDMPLEKMEEVVLQKLDDQQVVKLCLPSLSDAVKTFLLGEMPVETIARLAQKYRGKGMSEADILKNFGEPQEVHPAITKALQRHTAVAKKPEPKLPRAQSIAKTLLAEGRIKATPTQTRAILKKLTIDKATANELIALLLKENILYERPDGKPTPWTDKAEQVITQFFTDKKDREAKDKAQKIVAQLIEKTLQTNTTWSLEIRKSLREAIEKPWLHEPNPENADKYLYAYSLEKFRNGKNPALDIHEHMFEYVKQGKLSLEFANECARVAMEQESADIRVMVLALVNKSAGNLSVEDMIKALYVDQKKVISDKEYIGEYFILPEKVRLQIALDCLKELIHPNHVARIDKIQQQIEATMIKTPMPGTITSLTEKIEVEAGDVVATVNVMKMDHDIKAHSKGKIKLACKKGDTLKVDDILANYESMEVEKKTYEKFSALLKEGIDQKTAIVTQEASAQTKILSGMHQDMEKIVANTPLATPPDDALMAHLQKCGYYGPKLSLLNPDRSDRQKEIHVIDNRSGCAAKLYADLKQAGYEVRVLYTQDDATTPIIANALPGEAILVDSYTEHQIILDVLQKLAIENAGKKIYLHPGWGFLSENDAFVAKVEALSKTYHVEFVGPPSKPMDKAGNKLTLRHALEKLKKEDKLPPEFNPPYFGHGPYNAAQLQAYIKGGFKAETKDKDFSALDKNYRADFADIIARMDGDVMIKSAAGGGGRGILSFKFDKKQSQELNYQRYVTTVQKNLVTSEKLFKSSEMLTEQRVRSKTGGGPRHVEMQFMATQNGSRVLGMRDCTAQNNGQKIIETNIKIGDYPPEVIDKILKASKETVQRLAEQGYEGVGTLEMLVLPDGTATILEVNTRVQVEHMVTEKDVALKTGKQISLPLINLLCKKYPKQTPEEILAREFGLTPADLMKIMMPGEERVTHLRVNSREVNTQTGLSVASYVHHYMEPGTAALDKIAKETGATLIAGGIGQGKYDPQTGAICGTEKEVLAAAEAYLSWLETSQACYRRSDGKLSLPFVLEVYKHLMFNQQGNFSPDMQIATVDKLLENIEKKNIAPPEIDTTKRSFNPRLKSGAIKNVLGEMMRYEAEQEKLMQVQQTVLVK